MKNQLARVHLEITKGDALPFGGLADLVKRYNLHTEPQEVFWVIANDVAGNVRTIIEVARGAHDTVALDLPSLFTAVLATASPAFSIAHNHPTGSALPSVADVQLTNSVVAGANQLGLLVEDHVIVEPGGDSFSFRTAGMITGAKRPSPRAASIPKRSK